MTRSTSNEPVSAAHRRNLHDRFGEAQLELKRVQLATDKLGDAEIIRLVATALALTHQAEDRLYYIERTLRG